MAATIIEPEIKPDIIKNAIEYLEKNNKMGERSLSDSNEVMSYRVGYQDAIRNLLKFTVEGEYNTDEYIEGYFA